MLLPPPQHPALRRAAGPMQPTPKELYSTSYLQQGSRVWDPALWSPVCRGHCLLALHDLRLPLRHPPGGSHTVRKEPDRDTQPLAGPHPSFTSSCLVIFSEQAFPWLSCKTCACARPCHHSSRGWENRSTSVAGQGTFSESPREKESLCLVEEEMGNLGRVQGSCQHVQKENQKG